MRIIYKDWLKTGLSDYLLSQKGIEKVEIIHENTMDCIIVDSNISPRIVANYIELYQDNKWPIMLSFDKQNSKNVKKYNYKVKDICCEYCYMRFIRKLFEDDRIISVDSSFSSDKPNRDIEYVLTTLDICEDNEMLVTFKDALCEIGIS